jgi:hypothetical protein
VNHFEAVETAGAKELIERAAAASIRRRMAAIWKLP